MPDTEPRLKSALAGLEPPVRLVDHIGAAAAADDPAVAVTRLERLERVANLHGRVSLMQNLVVFEGAADRKSVVSGKSVSVRVDLGGRRSIKKKKKNESTTIN